MTEKAPPYQTQPSGYQRQSHPVDAQWAKWQPNETKTLTILNSQATRALKHWLGGRSHDCTGAQCGLCTAGDRPKTRWTVDVETTDGLRLWEMANATFTDLENVAEAMGQLKGLVLQVKRSGTGNKTRYTIIPTSGAPGTQTQIVDPKGQAQYIATLCTEHGLDAKAEYKVFLGLRTPELMKADSATLMNAFQRYVEAQVEGMTGEDGAQAPPDNLEDELLKFF